MEHFQNKPAMTDTEMPENDDRPDPSIKEALEIPQEHQEASQSEGALLPVPGLPAIIPNAIGDSEEFTDLVVQCRQRNIRTLLFTGTESGQGVTTIATQFASALAQDHGVNILLVEANLRSPSLRERFDIQDSASVADIMSGHKNLRISVPVVRNGLHILPAGELSMSPQAVYRSGAFDKLLQAARKSFDLTILDCPAINLAAETRLLAGRVDGCVLVLESGKTKVHSAKEAKKRIESAGGKLVGAVLNRVKHYIPEWLYRKL